MVNTFNNTMRCIVCNELIWWINVVVVVVVVGLGMD